MSTSHLVNLANSTKFSTLRNMASKDTKNETCSSDKLVPNKEQMLDHALIPNLSR